MPNYGPPTEHPSGTRVRPLIVGDDLDDLDLEELREVAAAADLSPAGTANTLRARLRRARS